MRIKNKDYASLKEFARKVGLSPAYLSCIENEKESPPSETVVEMLAEALGADKYELFSFAGKIPAEFLETFKKNPKGVASFLRRIIETGLETDTDGQELESSLLKIRRKSQG